MANQSKPGQLAGVPVHSTTPARPGAARSRWWRRIMSVAAAASLASVGLAATPAQAQVVECTQTFQNVTIPGSVDVPNGATCRLINVMVVGDAQVGSGADLILEQTVVGEIFATSDAFVFADGAVAAGGVGLKEAFGFWAVNSMIFSGVEAKGGASSVLVLSDGSNFIGDVTANRSWTVLQGGQVNGAVATTSGQATDLIGTTVSGGATIGGSANGALLCGVTSGDDIWVTAGGGGVVQIGGPFPTPACAGNFIGGDLQVHDNHGQDNQISGNTILGDARCTGNTPAPVGHGNIIIGTAAGQCAAIGVGEGLIPPPNSRGAQEATTADQRVPEIEQRLKERLKTAMGQPSGPSGMKDGLIRLAP